MNLGDKELISDKNDQSWIQNEKKFVHLTPIFWRPKFAYWLACHWFADKGVISKDKAENDSGFRSILEILGILKVQGILWILEIYRILGILKI